MREAGAIIEKDKLPLEVDILLSYDGEGLKEYVEGQKYPPPSFLKLNSLVKTAL